MTSPPFGTWTNGKSLGIACAKPGAASCGEPIDLGSGNMFYQVEDYATAGQNPLAFARYYNSMAAPDTSAVAMGRNWRHAFDRTLHIINPSAIYGVTAERPDEGVISFSSNAGVYTPDTDTDYSLTVAGGTWTLTGPDDTIETYSASGGLATLQTIKKRGGYTQTMHYTGGRLSSVTDSYSRSLGISYDSAGRLAGVTTPDSLALSYGYVTFSSAARLTTVSYNTSPGTSQTYLYENASYPFALTGITDENGNRFATWTYEGQGRATSSQLAGGADLTQISYSSANNDRTVTGPLGIQETYRFTYLQGVPKVTRIDRAANGTVAAASRLFTYDSNGYLASETDWNGNQTAYVNNAHGLPTQIVYASGSADSHTTTIAYDTTWQRLAKTITTPGLTTVNNYDAATGMLTGRVLTDTTMQSVPYSTNGQTRTWSYSWSATGQLRTVRLPRTDVLPRTVYAYSGSHLSTITDPVGNVTTVNTTTPGNLPLTVTDENGVLTTLAYNTRNWLTSSALTTGAGTLTTGIQYDSAGNLTKTTLPDSSYLSYGYDAAHRLTSVANALSETKTLTLDAAGNVTGQIWKNTGGVTKWERDGTFDSLGRMLTDVDGVNHATAFAYDSQGNALTVTDPLSHATHRTFDALNRLKTLTDPATDLVQWTYDAHDRPLTITDAKGNVTSYVYDGFGEVIQVSSPDAGTTVYHYDKDGNVSSLTDASGAVTNFTYDANDRMLTRSYPADSSLNIAFTYDQPGHGFGIGRLTSLTDQSGSLSRSYDERGLVTSDARALGGTTYTTGYSYDAAGRLAGVTYPTAGWTANYTRDAAGQVKTVKATQPGHSAVNIATVVKHMPFGPLLSLTWGNGVTDARTFDHAYRTLTLVDTGTSAIQSLTYTYDAADNVKTINDAVTPANNQTLNYDILDRLSSGTGGYSTGAITYDSNSNRLTYGATNYTYAGGGNRLATVGGVTVTHTAAGNVSAIGADTMTYNKANQLASATVSGTASTYGYDAFGQRLQAVVGANPASVTQYGPDGEILSETNGGVETDYVWLDAMPVAAIQPAAATISYIHPDRLGTPQKATDASKAVVWSGNYLPFGAVTPAGTITQNLRFPGQYADATGYYRNGFRTYSPALGRYLESDPIGLAGGLNIYGYAGQNPFKNVDPSGLNPLLALAVLPEVEEAATGVWAVYRAYRVAQTLNTLANEKQDQKGGTCPVSGTSPGESTRGPTENRTKPGDIEDANKDFDDLQPSNVRNIGNGGRAGTLPDGRTIVVRPTSSDGRPTVEIQDGRARIKIRYGTK